MREAPSVEIEWIDSGSMVANDAWTSTNEVIRKAHVGPVLTRGHLLKLDDEVAVVGLSHDKGFDNWFGVQVIGRANIVYLEVLRSRKRFLHKDLDSAPKGSVVFDTSDLDGV